MALQGGLHAYMLVRRQRLRGDEMIRKRCLRAELLAIQPYRVILDHFLAPGAVRLQHLAREAVCEHRLDPGRHVVGQQRDGAGRRDRGQQGVAYAVPGNQREHISIELAHALPGEVGLAVEQREGTLLGRDMRRGDIGGAVDQPGPALGDVGRVRRAIARSHHHQRVRQPGQAEADASLGVGLAPLLLQGKSRGVDGVVEHAHRDADQFGECRLVDVGGRGERVAHQRREVDRAEQAGAVGRQRLLRAGIGRANGLAVIEVVAGVDAVDEQHAWLGIVVGGLHDAVPQPACPDGAVGHAAEHQRPLAVRRHGGHEGVGGEHGEVEVAQPAGFALGGDERLDVWMVAAHRRHHRPAPRAGGHDGAAHAVPHVHESERSRCVRADAFDRRTLGAQGRKIIADAAALLHGQRRLAQMGEDAAEVVLDVAHHEAVEQRHPTFGAGARDDAAGRKKLEILQGLVEPLLPQRRFALDGGQGTCDAAPALLDSEVDRGAVRVLEAVFIRPDLPRDRRHPLVDRGRRRCHYHVHHTLLRIGPGSGLRWPKRANRGSRDGAASFLRQTKPRLQASCDHGSGMRPALCERRRVPQKSA